jgi:RNA polymerase-binding protein DksA
MSPAKRKTALTREDLKKLRAALLERRRQLVGDVAGLEDEALRAGEEEVSVDHMADHGSESYEKDQTIGHIERESAELKRIDQALKRIEAGSYGICEQCGKPIKKTRLRAMPSAGLCLACQTELEENSA